MKLIRLVVLLCLPLMFAAEVGAMAPSGQDAPGPEGAAVEQLAPLSRVSPYFSSSARREDFQGWVVVQYSLSDDGSVASAEVLDSLPGRIFEQEALEAIKRWRYPPSDAGQPRGQRINLQARFRFVWNPGSAEGGGKDGPSTEECPPTLRTVHGPIEPRTCTMLGKARSLEGAVGEYRLRFLFSATYEVWIPYSNVFHQLRAIWDGAEGTDREGLEIVDSYTSALHYRQGDRSCVWIARVAPVPEELPPILRWWGSWKMLVRGSVCRDGDPIDSGMIRKLIPFS